MKIRAGFVSNSSSSSFVLDKCDMIGEQITQFKAIIGEANRCEGTYIYESKRHFFGDLSMHDEKIPKFLRKNDLKADTMM